MPTEQEKIEKFNQLWVNPGGWVGWMSAVNYQPVGARFMVTSLVFFLLGGVLAVLMRVQLTVAENTFLGPEVYNQLFTMHGSTMMYLFAVPFVEGLGMYLLPQMLGARDVAFPRLSAFSYWTYLFGGIIFYASFLVGAAPAGGWFAYTPLSGPKFSGMGLDFWLMGLALVEVAGICAAVEIVVTILKFRAPGMSLNRMPVFIWTMLVTGVMIIFAFTTLLTATLLLELDRALGTRFFDAQLGGNSLLWQHLFWFFGHPEVYIAFIPATGVVSMIIPVFARRPLVGYVLVVVAVVATGFLSFGLWVHHMYTTGLPELAMSFFAAASLMIALASGTQVFAWIATLWGSRPELKTPLMFVLGFLFLFVLGGLTGVMVAIPAFDWQVHDTYFLVAHFHYVLIGGVVFPILAAIHYWMPKMTGRMLNEAMGHWSFWLTFIGFNLTFFPMHIMGFIGMPRRVYTYSAVLGLDGYNIVATVGTAILSLGFILIAVNFFYSLRRGREVSRDPWSGDTLEWSIESPPPVYTFFRPPIVHSLFPMWVEAPRDKGTEEEERVTAALAGEPIDWRATLVTDALHARPQAIQFLPSNTYVPLHAAIGLLIASAGVVAQNYLLVPVGLVYTVGAVVAWLRPRQRQIKMRWESKLNDEAGLPTIAQGTKSTPWWGTVMLLAILGTAFAALFYAYFYLRLFSERWPQDGLPHPDLFRPSLPYALLAVSGGAMYFAARGFWDGRKRPTQLGLLGALVLGAAFVSLQLWELTELPFLPDLNAYASLFYLISWALALLVVTGLGLLLAALHRATRHHADREGFTGLQMQVTGLFWYFTVTVGVLVFAVLYVSPYILD